MRRASVKKKNSLCGRAEMYPAARVRQRERGVTALHALAPNRIPHPFDRLCCRFIPEGMYVCVMFDADRQLYTHLRLVHTRNGMVVAGFKVCLSVLETPHLEVGLFNDADPQLGLVCRGGAQEATSLARGKQVIHHHLSGGRRLIDPRIAVSAAM